MVRFDDTLRQLRQVEGITRLQLVANDEAVEVGLNPQGKCER
jgi:hypothetical protein